MLRVIGGQVSRVRFLGIPDTLASPSRGAVIGFARALFKGAPAEQEGDMNVSSRALRSALVTALALALLLAAGAAHAPAAHAYGRLAQYQIGLSFNCNNTAYCGTDLGGFWGWAE